jgi:cytochrome c-type biogenesis protein CcmH/NrfF
VRQQIRSGKSKDEVSKYLTATYGWGALQQRMSLDGVMTEMK